MDIKLYGYNAHPMNTYNTTKDGYHVVYPIYPLSIYKIINISIQWNTSNGWLQCNIFNIPASMPLL